MSDFCSGFGGQIDGLDNNLLEFHLGNARLLLQENTLEAAGERDGELLLCLGAQMVNVGPVRRHLVKVDAADGLAGSEGCVVDGLELDRQLLDRGLRSRISSFAVTCLVAFLRLQV
jgi:hypothetical protein